MTQIVDMIKSGGIYIDHCFLQPDQFADLKEKVEEYEYDALYQPYGVYYGNRLQAFPCYETKHIHEFDKDTSDLLESTVQKIVGTPLLNFHAIARYSLTEEVLKSKKNTRYHPPHTDATDCAGVIYFDQTSTGGTAFYRTQFENQPDIEVGACPNRMICYSGQMLHSPSNDFTFDKRTTIAFFFDLE